MPLNPHWARFSAITRMRPTGPSGPDAATKNGLHEVHERSPERGQRRLSRASASKGSFVEKRRAADKPTWSARTQTISLQRLPPAWPFGALRSAPVVSVSLMPGWGGPLRGLWGPGEMAPGARTRHLRNATDGNAPVPIERPARATVARFEAGSYRQCGDVVNPSVTSLAAVWCQCMPRSSASRNHGRTPCERTTGTSPLLERVRALGGTGQKFARA